VQKKKRIADTLHIPGGQLSIHLELRRADARNLANPDEAGNFFRVCGGEARRDGTPVHCGLAITYESRDEVNADPLVTRDPERSDFLPGRKSPRV
jgi:hypothetical protein